MSDRILILGAGSAGFLTALTLKTHLPQRTITVLRSKDLGIIGVGEGTTANVPTHLHRNLKLDLQEFWRDADVVPKLGIRFLKWGPRPYFDYVFGRQFDWKFRELPREVGFYCDEDVSDASTVAALMSRNLACLRGPDGAPVLPPEFGYHIENERFVDLLERHVRRLGVTIIDDTVTDVRQDEQGIAELRLASGGAATADLFIDCSGFRSVLLGGALQEPFLSFKSTLFCDRAVVGGWDRMPDEPIQPYTTAETMDAGWCWRIDHERRINRGYVYSSAFISDEEAEREFRAKNPKVSRTRIVPFATGHYQRAWVKNVVAIGNALGFVEPLEATSLGTICASAQNLAEILAACTGPIQPSTRRMFNLFTERLWHLIRRFLAVHYRFNTALDTPFWRACRADVDLAGVEEIIEFYRENGPTALWRNVLNDPNDSFGPEGFLTMFVGQKVPHQDPYIPSDEERARFNDLRRRIAAEVSSAFTVPDALRAIRNPAPPPPPRPMSRPVISSPFADARPIGAD